MNVNKSIIKALVSETNPFMLVYGNGQPMIFRQDHESYYHVIMAIHMKCQKGYFELPYLLTLLYPTITMFEIRKMMKLLLDLKVPYVTTLKWGSSNCRIYFQTFFIALHSVCDTQYKQAAFITAYNMALNIILSVQTTK